MEQNLGDLRERVAVVEQSTKSAHLRIDDVHEQTRAIIEMGSAVRYMAKQVEEVVGILKEHDERLGNLEKAPADSVLKAVKIILTVLVTALITYFVSGG